ncbi:MAG: choice-of-anchor D domain-containing protein [Deltaproteobacteria bacterium]|nr:choice-of-anchor D domain-containing protein [Deltaproteobacteria bacterium]
MSTIIARSIGSAGRRESRSNPCWLVFLVLASAAVAGAGCSSDLSQILGGDAGDGGVARRACNNNAQCEKNEICKNKVCVATSGDGGDPVLCQSSLECGDGEECLGGQCVPAGDDGGGPGGDDDVKKDGGLPNGDGDPCKGVAACGPGYRCNPEAQKCEPAAIAKVDPTLLDFGAVPYNSEVKLSLTVSNIGKLDLKVLGVEFEQGTNPADPAPARFKKNVSENLPATLKEGEYITVEVSYRQDDALPDTGALLVTSTDIDHSLTRVPMMSTYKGAPDLAIIDRGQNPPAVLYPLPSSTSDYTIDVGNVALGGSKQTIVTFMNATQGDAILSFDETKVHQKTDNEFVITFRETLNPAKEVEIPIYISPADMVDMYIDYAPTQKVANEETDLDLYTNDKDINNNGGGNDDVLYLKIRGKAGWLPPGISVTKSQINFGEVQRNTVATDSVRVCNDGGDALTIAAGSGLAVQGTDFSVSPTPLARVLNPTDCFDITVYFGPKTIGTANNNLVIDSNDTNNPHIVIPLTGTGSDPTITVFPTSIDFGYNYVGKPAAPQTVSMKNTGIGMLRVTKIQLTPGSSLDYGLTGVPPLPASLRDNQQDTVTFAVTFTPSTKGKVTGAVQIDNGDVKSPVVIVNLSGEGSDCPPGTGDCDGDPGNGCESNVLTDKNHCGGCTTVCAPANATGKCVQGDCKIDLCDQGFGDCNVVYSDGCETNTTNDPQNCSACNGKCMYANATGKCVNSQCQFEACLPGFDNCNGQTTDGCESNVNTDVTHCGNCTTTCSVANGTPKCEGGQCGIASCLADYRDCDVQYGTGCEVNIKTDVNNCNACGQPCGAVTNGTAGCSGGQCVVANCNTNFDNCDGLYANGCEVDLRTNVNNCGICSKKCTTANGTPKCENKTCGIQSCNIGFDNCDGNVTNGCETNLTLSATCGTCTNNCDATCATGNCIAGCASGSCVVQSCLGDWRDCDTQFANGCEADINSNVSNCGTCGFACTVNHGTGQCINKVCSIASCTAPWKDCSGGYGDGCETDTSSDTSNCGNCGTVCSVSNGTPKCTGNPGVCGILSCNDPWRDCTGGYADGCETNTSNNVSHCGGCNAPCNLANAVPKCETSQCKIDSCNSTWNNLDGVDSTGCECQHDAYDAAATPRGNSCGTTEPGTILLGDKLDDSSATETITGNIASATDVDWYRVRALDSRAQDVAAGGDQKFKFSIKWLANPSNEFQFDVQAGACATGMCTGIDSASPAGDGTHMSQYYNFGNRSAPVDPNAIGGNPCYDSGNVPNANQCEDNTQTYYVKVYRNPAKPKTCGNYQLKISNGIQNP